MCCYPPSVRSRRKPRREINDWAAAILAAAPIAGCDAVYTEDLSDGQAEGGVRVVNSFRGIPNDSVAGEDAGAPCGRGPARTPALQDEAR